MDPHLVAVRDWSKNYIPNEKDAYYEARINGYVFNQDIGTLSKNELEAIASHPPSIDYRNYKRYTSMTINELANEFPELVHILGEDLTYEDLFYYATRGWIPEHDSINLKLERWKRYEELSNVGKSLINLLYGDREGFIESNPHNLEQIILDYDENMDDESVLRAIAEREGFILPEGEFAQDSFYDILVSQINHR